MVPASSGSDSRTESHTIAGQSESVYHKEIARLAGQVADALDYAHGQRRRAPRHQAVQPLARRRGNVWVTDFGLAKFVEGDDLSQSHDLVGTLRFMAPERFRGVTDRRADIYAVGATLVRDADAAARRSRSATRSGSSTRSPTSRRRRLRQLDRRIPRDLETIVLKALAKDPKDRFATAGELRDELRRFLEKPADPLAPDLGLRAVLAVVQAQPRPGRRQRTAAALTTFWPSARPSRPGRTATSATSFGSNKARPRRTSPGPSMPSAKPSRPSTRPGSPWASRWSPRGRHSSARG